MIETRHLTKKFGDFTAVNNLSLRIIRGESYGFLGPNGSGKTTTLMMLLGILKPTSGSVLIDGRTISTSSFAIKRRIGVVAEYQKFYEEMTAWEYLMFFAKLYEVEDVQARASDLLKRVELLKWKDVVIGGYSTGMKKKLGYVRALLPSPDLLVFDEPVSGLDPFGIIQVRELLDREKKLGRTFLISSHILSELERTVDRVGIISSGKLIAEGTMDNLREIAGERDRYELSFASLSEAQAAAFCKLPSVVEVKRAGNQLTIFARKGEQDLREAIGRQILTLQLVATGLEKVDATLEETFITITENTLSTFTDTLSAESESA